MRIVAQRVNNASVSVSSQIVGKIDGGLFVLVGFKKGDTEKQVNLIAEKLAKLRLMADEEKKMNLSVKETTAQVLVVSQFTLNANTKDGNRPSFTGAMEPNRARELYQVFISRLNALGLSVQQGSFGEYMQINANLDGPVTIILES